MISRVVSMGCALRMVGCWLVLGAWFPRIAAALPAEAPGREPSAAQGFAADPGPPAPARENAETPYSDRFSVMAGLSQWLVFGGGNIAAQYKTGRLVFEYSHGQGLRLNQLEPALTSAEREAEVDIAVPWTTGGGAGFQITPELHLLLEFKAHRYEVSAFDGSKQLAYTTFSIGPGAFYDLYLYKGLYLQPSLRFWPNIASTLKSKDAKLPAPGGTEYTHESHDFSVFVNVSLGWTFTGV